MMTRLREAMRAATDLDTWADADAEPGRWAGNGPEPDARAIAGAAWRRGIRRRWRARLAGAGATVVALALLFVAVTGGVDLGRRSQPPAGDDGGRGAAVGVSAYPKRIGPSLIPPRPLPARPGPLAGLFQGNTGWPWQDGAGGWLGFDAQGHVWRLPHMNRTGVYPALSDDGVWLATIPSATSGWVVRNLVTGDGAFFPVTKSHETRRGDGVMLYPEGGQQWPQWFSPSGDLMVVGNQSLHEDFVDLVLGPEGSMTEFTGLPSWGAGWLDDRRYLFLEPTDATNCANAKGCPLTLRVVVLDTTSRARTEQRLEIPGITTSTAQPWFGLGQWTPRLSADRRTLWLADDGGDASGTRVLRLSVDSSGRVALANAQPDQPYAATLGDAMSAADGLVPVGSGPAILDGNALVVTDRTQWRAGGGSQSWKHTAMLIHPTRHIGSLLVAADAFAGEGTGFATPDNVLGWWWLHLVAVTLLLAWVGIGIRHRRRSPNPAAGAEHPHKVDPSP